MDFPAAHSMDTTWFAVDRCGHVGVFHSGEYGAVPNDAPNAELPFESCWPFPGELDRCLREKTLVPGVHGTRIEKPGSNSTQTIAPGFFLLGGSASDRSRCRSAESQPGKRFAGPWFGTTDGRDWVEGFLCPESWTWLHEMPHRCLGCVRFLPLDVDRRLEVLRVFRFDCTDYGTLPYEQTHTPHPAATLDELRPLLAGVPAEVLRFTQFCFREKRRLQPLQWLPSRTYGSDDDDCWVDEEGRRRKGDGTILE